MHEGYSIVQFFIARRGIQDISKLNVKSYRSHLALVSQEPTLYQGTIRKNITLGTNDEDISEEKITKVCQDVNIYALIQTLPDGISTIIGARGAMLTGGQQQRIAITRALHNSRILLLDEATSAQDSESEKVAQNALNAAAQGRTAIAVAHRISTVQKADCIYVLHKGNVVEQGTHQELMERRGRCEGSQIREVSPVSRERSREPKQRQQQTEPLTIVENIKNGLVHESATKYKDPHYVPPEDPTRILEYSKWPVPATMFGLILVGIIIGIGHHLCYNYLNGKPVANYSQAWILRVATGAAFLVKVIFAISVGIALSLRSNGSQDLLAAPLVLLMAALLWSFGIISILTPSTLSVTYTTHTLVRPCKVPMFGAGSPSSLTVWQQAPGGNRTPYGGPAPSMSKIAAKTIVGGTPVEFASPCGQNCSYSTSFMGPAMSCETQSFKLGQAVLGPGVVHDIEHGDFFYYYASPDAEYKSMIWVLSNQKQSRDGRPDILLCGTWNTTYNVDVTFSAGIPTFKTTIGNLSEADKVDWGESFNNAYYASVGIENATVRQALDMAAVRDSLYGNLAGIISMRLDEQNAFESNTSFVLSNLVDMSVNEIKSTFSLKREIKTGVPELMQNITLSVMGRNTPTSTTECTSFQTELVYHYSPLWLLVPYFVGFGLSFLCASIGLYTLVADGVPVEDNFSQILVTTRNPALDEICGGLCLTSNQGEYLKEQRIRFGELIREDGLSSGVCHAAFGLEGQTVPIQKGRKYH
ncbi:uncharacterized protein PGRI_033190 [Penicillium griseofulvum]|uniref:ABC multidrug transporter MDR2 n=1 Tax=Penicillium patulum TaxID=5078 RepID=A0A135L9B2_PENPA|nr:uncharacterized protein PGRI_033190 [Penicillium griseofulvum]KXG45552.1 hypothetical protein PGRI_033190 [Penicillium griseofulvum]